MPPQFPHKGGDLERTEVAERQKSVAAGHFVQLFDTQESLAQSVASFLAAGRTLGETLLVVCTAAHWDAIQQVLAASAFDVHETLQQGQLVVLDAHEILPRLMRRGRLSRSRFRRVICPMIGELSAESGNGLRIYGELVELLAQEGDYQTAERLEVLWNEVACEYPLTLLCGYSAAHFAAPDAGCALARIRLQHSGTIAHAGDALGHFLLHADRRQTGSPA